MYDDLQEMIDVMKSENKQWVFDTPVRVQAWQSAVDSANNLVWNVSCIVTCWSAKNCRHSLLFQRCGQSANNWDFS